MNTRRSHRNQARLWKDLSGPAVTHPRPTVAPVKVEPIPEEPEDRLFAGIYPGGIVYADRFVEEGGDYKRIAFLPYSTLALEWSDPKHQLRTRIEKDAATIQAQRGQLFAVSSSATRDSSGNLVGDGQTVRLGA